MGFIAGCLIWAGLVVRKRASGSRVEPNAARSFDKDSSIHSPGEGSDESGFPSREAQKLSLPKRELVNFPR